MSTQRLQTRPETEPQPDRTATRTPTERPIARPTPRAAVESSPRTFSRRNTAQLENLIDEFNAAFAGE